MAATGSFEGLGGLASFLAAGIQRGLERAVFLQYPYGIADELAEPSSPPRTKVASRCRERHRPRFRHDQLPSC